jgi:hypothetical protein
MDKKILIRIVSRTTLGMATLALVASLALAPRASAQGGDNQPVAPAQPDMQRPDAAPVEPQAAPDMNQQYPEREMDNRQERDRDQDRDDRDRDQGYGRESMRQDVARFDEFLDHHPEIEQDLQNDPSLVNDRRYVSSHGDLEEFLEHHSRIRDEIRDNPDAFMRKQRHQERREEEHGEEQRPPQY